MSLREPCLPLLIDGVRVPGEAGVAPVIDPYSGTVVAECSLASAAQLADAVSTAALRFRELRRTPAHRRGEWLHGISSRITARKEELARLITLEVGKPIRAARVEVERAATTFRLAAEETSRGLGETMTLDAVPNGVGLHGYTARRPRGVVAAITPFNFPLNLLAHKVAPALACGGCVVAKPAPRSPEVALTLGEIALEAGVPPGAFNVVPTRNELVPNLISHPQVSMVSFTGSAAVGKRILEQAGLRKVSLELGGNAPNIVTPSARLDGTVAALVAGGFTYSGQVCISVQRIYVHRSIFAALRERLCQAVNALRSGAPLDESTELGPMISEEAAMRAESWIEEARAAGAEVATGGVRSGSFVAPTVLVEPPEHLRCVAEEAFAPLVTLHAYDELAGAIERANRSRYALNAAIFTNDLREAFEAVETLEAGTVLVNQSSAFRADHLPYGGLRESGLGREGLRYAIEEMTEPRAFIFRPFP